MYDFIGDIHGYADELKLLLEKLGYKQAAGVYRHPSRKAFFTGDFIDRGPQIRETMQIVRTMIENNQALTVMGNHEYNAICYNIKDGAGNYLRKRTAKNIDQHAQTVKQFENHSSEYEAYIKWFRTLPLFWETDEFRVVHACWDEKHISNLCEMLNSNDFKQGKALPDKFFKAASSKSEVNYNVVEETLKGKELPLPDGKSFLDKDNKIRHEIRIKWWVNPFEQKWQDISFHHDPSLPDGLVDQTLVKPASHYSEHEKPVFFGHYWCKGRPQLFRSNVCCLDYSVAKNDRLVAYRFNGERQLNNNNFVFVNSRKENSIVE